MTLNCPLCFMFGKAMVISEAMHGQPFREAPRTSGRQPLLVRFRSSSSTPVLIALSDEGATLTTGRDPLPPSTSSPGTSPRYGRLRIVRKKNKKSPKNPQKIIIYGHVLANGSGFGSGFDSGSGSESWYFRQ
jgi:hypothetical protein